MKNNTNRFACGLLACILPFCITGCMNQDGMKANTGADDATQAMKTMLGTPIVPPSCDTVLIPLRTDSSKQMIYGGISSGWYSTSWLGTGSYSVSGDFLDSGAIYWNNVVFFDKKNQQSRLLLDWRAVICQYLIPHSDTPSTPPKPPQYFLFAIADADTNKDGVINGQDALCLYVSDPSGHKITRVTPADTHFETAVFDDTNDHALYVEITLDSNHDGKFTENDATVILLVDPLNPSEGTPVVSDQLKRQAFKSFTASKDSSGGNKQMENEPSGAANQ
jgi:hypothetical protein